MNPEKAALIGKQIGHIQIVDQIGAGGMGAVYTGFDEKLQRQVAVKAIRREFRLQDDAKARFLREARILSQLDHPRVCRVFDFIEGDEGDYLVLELVKGKTLRQTMAGQLDDKEKTSIAGQLLEVLKAVHGMGVIHRDLKPENVMILPDSEIKVLDFGLSRSVNEDARGGYEETPTELAEMDVGTDPDLTLAAPSGSASEYVQTRLGALVGTVGYMSPEQARGEPATSASDMYSAGLMLQEIFTGKPPYDDGLDPSELLTRVAKGETQPVTGLSSDFTKLIERLTALAPGARPSAQDAADLLQKILYRPVRRRRRLIAGSVVAILFILLATFAVREGINARRLATERDTAQQVSDFMIELFQVADPHRPQGTKITARELLDNAVNRIEDELAEQPEVQARMMSTLGAIYQRLGIFEPSQRLLETALATRRRILGEEHPDTLSTLDSLATVLNAQGRLDEAEPMYRQAIETSRRVFGHQDRRTLLMISNLCTVVRQQGKFDEAEDLCREAVDGLRELGGVDDQDAIVALQILGAVHVEQARLAEAEQCFRQALESSRRVLGNDHPNTLYAISGMSYLLKEQGKLDEAEPYYREALESRRRVLGDDHPSTLTSLTNMGLFLKQQGRLDEAETFYRQALEGCRRVLGEDSDETLVATNNLGVLLKTQGRYEEAEPLYLDVVSGYRRRFGDDHPRTVSATRNLGILRKEQGRFEEAEQLLTQALEGGRRVVGEDHPSVALTMNALGELALAQGNLDKAEALSQNSLELAEAALGPAHPSLARILHNLALVHAGQGRLDASDACFERAISILEQVKGEDHPQAEEMREERARVLSD